MTGESRRGCAYAMTALPTAVSAKRRMGTMLRPLASFSKVFMEGVNGRGLFVPFHLVRHAGGGGHDAGERIGSHAWLSLALGSADAAAKLRAFGRPGDLPHLAAERGVDGAGGGGGIEG